MDNLYASAGGSLNLKRDSKVKKKKSKKQSKVISQITNTEDPTLKKVANRMTKAEMAFEKAREKRLEEQIMERASMSHKERIMDFNSHLDTLTEHFDIPKVSWTK